MKRLVLFAVVLGALASMTWGVGAMITREAASRLLDTRNADGWVAHADNITVSGFPIRFETVVTGLTLTDIETGLALSTPDLRLNQDTLRLDRMSANIPYDITLTSPEEQVTITHEGLTASLDVQPTNSFALDEMEFAVSTATLVSSAGWNFALSTADVAVTRNGTTAYDIVTTVRNATPPALLRNVLDPTGALPDSIATMDITLQLTFDAPWDREAIQQARPQPTEIIVNDISAVWGDMLFRTSGTLQVTPGGVPEGDLTIRAEDWRTMLDLALNVDLIPQQFQASADTMLGVLAGLSGQPENIDATLNFSNGQIFLGPIPLGPAPSLRLP